MFSRACLYSTCHSLTDVYFVGESALLLEKWIESGQRYGVQVERCRRARSRLHIARGVVLRVRASLNSWFKMEGAWTRPAERVCYYWGRHTALRPAQSLKYSEIRCILRR